MYTLHSEIHGQMMLCHVSHGVKLCFETSLYFQLTGSLNG